MQQHVLSLTAVVIPRRKWRGLIAIWRALSLFAVRPAHIRGEQEPAEGVCGQAAQAAAAQDRVPQ